MQNSDLKPHPTGVMGWIVTNLGRVVISIFVPVVMFVVLWQGFVFLRDYSESRLVVVAVAIVWGVGGVAALFFVTNWFVERLPAQWTRRFAALCFCGPRRCHSGLVPGCSYDPHTHLKPYGRDQHPFCGIGQFYFCPDRPGDD